MSMLLAPSTITYPPVVLPTPQTTDAEVAVPCWKCGGTGFWCKGVLNGKRPYSNTGFVCWACNGAGYKVVARARVITRKPAATKPTAA